MTLPGTISSGNPTPTPAEPDQQTTDVFGDSMYPLYIPLDNTEGTLVRVDSIDGAINEYNKLYEDVEPFEKIPMYGGDCYKWSEEFLYNCLVAFATDKLIQFSEQELQVFYTFINFENYHTHSARDTDANGTAIGCTVPNSQNESFVVATDGVILDGTDGTKKTFCQPATFEIELEEAWKSLDSAFMAIYNCEPVNDCNASDTMGDSTCPQ